eukprot:TRINITY_DN6784_c2_g1_i1.p1 TRINITY_DN6784_c2_g1~~TRINITY_DN6784_c2_g1_i1.p1  ORF type:complete len:797 (+),score=275.93 TRINITY_DN6784_c2_g1_i1:116-2392(+)
MDQADLAVLQEEWQHLREGFDSLVRLVEGGFQKPFDNAEWMQLYTRVYDLCTKHRLDASSSTPLATEILYNKYSELLKQYLAERQIGEKVGSRDAFLKLVVERWGNHKVVGMWMQRLFAYLDRFYTKHSSKDSLRDCGLLCFKETIYDKVKDELRLAVFDNILREREGELVDRTTLKEAINLFIVMGMDSVQVYHEDFEVPFLRCTAEYYERESSRWLAEDNATEYMKKAEARLAEELARAQSLLHSESEKKLIEEVEQQTLARHMKQLLDMEHSGFIALLRDHRLDDISRTYRLFHRIPQGLEFVARLMREYVTSEGKGVVLKHSGSGDLDFKAYTTDLLDIHVKYQSILKNQLNSDATFQKAVTAAFETFVNLPVQCGTKSAQPGMPPPKMSSSELISNYCDMLMKNHGERFGEDELDERFDQVVALFGYIADKDLFQEFYRKSLSKRLLVSQMNEEAEKALISKLKMRQGAPFTSRLEGMITDRNLSSDMQARFRDWQAERSVSFGFDYTVQVLTTGFWPAFQTQDKLIVPESITNAQERFKQFYDSRTQSRKLRWVHSLGSCTVDAALKNGRYQLEMSVYQACVLLLFNADPSLTGERLVAALELPWVEVKKVLQSFSGGKYKLLLRTASAAAADGRPSKVEPTDTFTLNESFSEKHRKLKIPTVVPKVNPKASAQVEKTVEEDRRHAIEACIVRIMKSRKQMDHSNLIGECIHQLSNHFKPDPKHIKKRIEDLIGREYLERDPDKPSVYRYLA